MPLTDSGRLTMQKVWLDTTKVTEVKKHMVGTLVCNTPGKKVSITLRCKSETLTDAQIPSLQTAMGKNVEAYVIQSSGVQYYVVKYFCSWQC